MAPSLHHPVDPVVEEAEAGEGDDALDHQLADVDVPYHVVGVQPEVRGPGLVER